MNFPSHSDHYLRPQMHGESASSCDRDGTQAAQSVVEQSSAGLELNSLARRPKVKLAILRV